MEKIPFISITELEQLKDNLKAPIEYRKSGLSLNHIMGCPLDCSYCIRHTYDNYEMKKPHRLLTDEEAVEQLLAHKYFVPNKTPIQIFNRATDPFLPSVKDSLFKVLSLLAEKGLTNLVIIITRFKISKQDALKLNNYLLLKVNLFITYSGIENKTIEPISSEIAKNSLRTAYEARINFKVILYWRPIISGFNDSEKHIEDAVQLSKYSDAVAFTGLFFREEVKNYFEENGLPMLYQEVARRKIFTEDKESKILKLYFKFGGKNIFRKTSCAISKSWQQPDYNGHYGIRELCDICPEKQVSICKSFFRQPDTISINSYLNKINKTTPFTVNERSIIFKNLDEQDRYFIQHNLEYQAHDISKPHYKGRHGRAEIGWRTLKNEH